MLPELLANPAFPRALAVGAFGGVGLVLTVVYSRRGPMIFVPYAALLAALTLLLSQFGQLPYAPRFAAAYAAFAMATVPVYVAVAYSASANASGACRPSHHPGGCRYGATYGASGLGS